MDDLAALTPREVTTASDRMRIAAVFRFEHPTVTWQTVAEHVGVNRKTLWEWRSSQEWRDIYRGVAADHVFDLAPAAIEALRRAWRRGNPAGALEVLKSLGYLPKEAKAGGETVRFTLKIRDQGAIDDEIERLLLERDDRLRAEWADEKRETDQLGR